MTIRRAIPRSRARPSSTGDVPAGRGRAPRRGLLACVAVLCAAAVLAGCSSVRDDLGTVDSDCYIALPAATNAVHHHGSLRGVRLVSDTSLRKHEPQLYRAASGAHGPEATQVCLVAFGGTFSAASVSRPAGRGMGHVAVVVLDYPDNHLLATVLFARQPLPFGHPRI